MNVGMALKCRGCIFTLVSANNTFFSACNPKPLYVSIVSYRVNILFKYIGGLRQFFHNFKSSYKTELLNPYYSNQCNMSQLQTTFSFSYTFRHYGLGYTVCLRFECIWELRNISQDINLKKL